MPKLVAVFEQIFYRHIRVRMISTNINSTGGHEIEVCEEFIKNTNNHSQLIVHVFNADHGEIELIGVAQFLLTQT